MRADKIGNLFPVNQPRFGEDDIQKGYDLSPVKLENDIFQSLDLP